MKTAEEAKDKFVEKWGWGRTNNYECLSDLNALISEHYTSKIAYKILSEHYQGVLASKDVEEDYIDKYYYPKEFVEWMGDKGIEKAQNDEEVVWILYKYNSIESEKEFNSLEELFNYWKENEK